MFHQRFLLSGELSNRSFCFHGFKTFLFDCCTTRQHTAPTRGEAESPVKPRLFRPCAISACRALWPSICLLRSFCFSIIERISWECNMTRSIPLLSAIDFANSFRSLRTHSRWICVHLSKRRVKRFIFALRSSNAKLMGAKDAMETGALSVIFAEVFRCGLCGCGRRCLFTIPRRGKSTYFNFDHIRKYALCTGNFVRQEFLLLLRHHKNSFDSIYPSTPYF